MTISRRSILGGLSAALVAAPAASQVTVEPSAEERAEFHFRQLAAALDEICAGGDGWLINAGNRPGDDRLFAYTRALRLETQEVRPGLRVPIERHRQIALLSDRPVWQDDET